VQSVKVAQVMLSAGNEKLNAAAKQLADIRLKEEIISNKLHQRNGKYRMPKEVLRLYLHHQLRKGSFTDLTFTLLWVHNLKFRLLFYNCTVDCISSISFAGIIQLVLLDYVCIVCPEICPEIPEFFFLC